MSKENLPELWGTDGTGSIPSTLPFRPLDLQEKLISRPEGYRDREAQRANGGNPG